MILSRRQTEHSKQSPLAIANRLMTYVKVLALQGVLLFFVAFIQLSEINLLNLVLILLETIIFKSVAVPAFLLTYRVEEGVLLITNPDDEVAQRVSAVMRAIEAECDIASYSTHIAKTGRIHVIEINIVVGENFAPQSVPQLDALRARIWDAIGLPLEQAWLGIMFTADPRWS